MTKVWCASIECQYNKGNRCRAKEINISDGHRHTAHEGVLHIWQCRNYEQTAEYKEMKAAIEKVLKGESDE